MNFKAITKKAISCALVMLLITGIFFINNKEIQADSIQQAITGFSTGHNIYFNSPATIRGGNEIKGGSIVSDSFPTAGGRAIVAASNDGTVMAFRFDGTPIWESKAGNAMLFSLCVYDIDNDGLDETMVPSADGTLYVFDDDGKLLWNFRVDAPLYSVTALKDSSGKVVILTSGVNKYLYKLNSTGNMLEKTTLKNEAVLTRMQSADLKGDGEERVIITGTLRDNWTTYLFCVDPDNISQPVWTADYVDIFVEGQDPSTLIPKQKNLGRFLIADLDNDNKKEIVLANQWGGALQFVSADGSINVDCVSKKNPTANAGIPRGYRSIDLSYINIEGQTPYILGHKQDEIVKYTVANNTCNSIAYTGKDAYIGGNFDEKTGMYLMCSDVSGGDEIFVIDLKKDTWSDEYKNLASIGRMAEIKANIAKMSQQIDSFVMPSYQQLSDKKLNIIAECGGVLPNTQKIDFSEFNIWSQVWTVDERRANVPEFYWDRTDNRLGGLYDVNGKTRFTVEQIVNMAANYESQGKSFTIWAGHCLDPYYMSLDTFDKILTAAPTTCKSLVFAEMDEPQNEVAVSTMLVPLAKLIQSHGTDTKIFFRDKYMFWNTYYQRPEWQKIISEEYKDVLVPSMEETNCRTHELSLAGRMGLWLTDTVDCWGGRLVEDNASVNKQFEWSMQKTTTNFTRNLVYQIANGANYFQNRVTTTNNQFFDVYKLYEKGALICPDPADLYSVSNVAIAFNDTLEEFQEKADNAHYYNKYDPETDDYVVNNIQAWDGFSPIKDFDISNYIYGCTDRVPNFLPTTPYGMVASVPAYNTKVGEKFSKVFTTDGKYFYINGKQYTPQAAKPIIENELLFAKKKLPFYVSGEAAWSAVKIDDTHTRLYLVDPGYLSPDDRNVTVVSNKYEAVKCTDILSGEELQIENNTINVDIPAGVFRIIDIETSEKVSNILEISDYNAAGQSSNGTTTPDTTTPDNTTPTNPTEIKPTIKIADTSDVKKQLDSADKKAIRVADITGTKVPSILIEIKKDSLNEKQRKGISEMKKEELDKEFKKIAEIIATVDIKQSPEAVKKKVSEASKDAKTLVLNFSGHAEFDFPVEVSIDLSASKLAAGEYYLYFYNDKTNTLEECGKAIVDKNGVAKFILSHCSEYVISDKKLVNSVVKPVTEIKNPKTGSQDKLCMQISLLTIQLILVGAFVFNRKTSKIKLKTNND